MTLPRVHHGAAAASGPLLFLERTRRAVLGEWAEIETAGGRGLRGQVIEAGTAYTVVQVLDDVLGVAPGEARVTLTGKLATAPVGRELLGRVFAGSGDALDDLPAPVGAERRPVSGRPLNPVRRDRPSDFIETGLSVIDGMNTLVRGQKLPVFSGPGLPGLEVAARVVEGARIPGDRPFAVIFVAVGITERETRRFLDRFGDSDVMARTALFLNRAADPTIERLLAPRRALTLAEHLAFEEGMEVLVVTADITHYCEALRQVGAAREEMPGRRGFPGHMYTDLASLFERAGVVKGRPGSLTQVPVLTMPNDDITHPVPDLTGYITEGQIVLDREIHRRGRFPPVDVLPSLSRLMNAGVGEGRTPPDHRAWADQLYAVYARGRDARQTAAIVGRSGLPEEDRRALAFADRFEEELVHQGEARRTVEESVEIGWRLLRDLPRDDLGRLDDEVWERHAAGEGPHAEPGRGGGGEEPAASREGRARAGPGSREEEA